MAIAPSSRAPAPDAPHEDADVETSSEAYARRFSGAVGAWFLERQALATRELLAPWPEGAVLDVGGGHGQLTGPLVEAGHAVTVFGSAQACGGRVGQWVRSGQARFEWGNLLSLPFADRSFDLVLCFRLLPHVTRWPELVAELCRVARHAVVVDYPTARSVNAAAGALFRLKKGVEGDTRPFTVFRDSELKAVFERHGFQPGGRRPQFVFPMALHRGLGLAAVSRALEAGATAIGLRPLLGSPVIARFERRG